MAHDSLVRFSDAIISDAEEKQRKYIERAQKRKEELINAKKTEFKEEYEKKVRYACSKIRGTTGLEVAQRRNELKYSLIKRRNEMFDDVFKEVVKNISEYVKKDEYLKNMSSVFEKATEKFNCGKTQCCAREEDIEFLKSLSEGKNIEFFANDEIIGGFTLKNNEMKIFVDFTLNEKIKEQKELFFINSGLVIE